MIGKYVERFMSKGSGGAHDEKKAGFGMDVLARNGFL